MDEEDVVRIVMTKRRDLDSHDRTRQSIKYSGAKLVTIYWP